MTRSKNLLTVVYHDQVVGHLAANPNNTTLAFEYDPAWLRNGFALSPFKLPLIAKLFVVPGHKLEGALGVFSDSLPDGWGRLLIDRLLRQRGIDYRTVSELERLAIVGASGKGALEYYPEHRLAHQAVQANLDQLAQACRRILQDQDSALLEQLTAAGSSAGGARPKIIRRINGEEWIIKFPASLDHQKIGLLEYQYSVIAKQVGITMSETRLFNGKYFGTKRFDRQLDGGKVHMLSAGALLDADYRVPALDYIDLINATRLLTKSYQEVEKLFK